MAALFMLWFFVGSIALIALVYKIFTGEDI